MGGVWLAGGGSVVGMEQQQGPATTATEEERAQVRALFRRKLAAAEARMTPEKRDKARAALGLPPKSNAA